MTAPTVRHGLGKVRVDLSEDVLDEALKELARNIHADAPSGPVATALTDLGVADAIASAPPEIRREWGVRDGCDADQMTEAALVVLRDAVGVALTLSLSPDACRRLIIALSAHVAAAEKDARADRAASRAQFRADLDEEFNRRTQRFALDGVL